MLDLLTLPMRVTMVRTVVAPRPVSHSEMSIVMCQPMRSEYYLL